MLSLKPGLERSLAPEREGPAFLLPTRDGKTPRYGFAAEHDVECKFRETRLLTVAPVSNHPVLDYLGQHVLGSRSRRSDFLVKRSPLGY